MHSQPARNPSVAAGASGAAYVMWDVSYRTPYSEFDALWSTTITGSGALTPTLLSFVLDSREPRLSVGPDSNPHATWLKFNTDNYDVYYAQGAGGPPHWDLDRTRSVYPLSSESNNPSVTLAREWWDEAVHPHVVWEEAGPGGGPPQIHYARDAGAGFRASPIGPNFSYYGYTPAVAVLKGRTAHVVWSGLDVGVGPRVIYWGHANIAGETFENWSDREIISTNIAVSQRANSVTQSCASPAALSPSVAVAPDDTLHVAWHEQTPDCSYRILTRRLEYFDGIGYAWSDPERVSVTPILHSYALRPRIGFDRLGGRYILWNADYQEVLIAQANARGGWTTPSRLNVGECAGQMDASGRYVDDVDLAADPAQRYLHAVWLARDPAGDKVCYSRLELATPYRAFLPRLLQRWAIP